MFRWLGTAQKRRENDEKVYCHGNRDDRRPNRI